MAPSVIELHELLPASSIVFASQVSDRVEAIRRSGALLVAAGCVDVDYVDQMLDRERAVSTFVGDGIAMPHGTLTAKNDVMVEGLSLLLLASPIDWGGSEVTTVIGIAAHGRRYITLLSQLATALLDEGRAESLRRATTPERVYELLAS
jgi:PTS system mannitol-specific IIA component